MLFGTQVEGLFDDSGALDALLALEQNTQESVARLRAHERLNIRVRVQIRPASSSQRHSVAIEAVTADVSNGGTMLLSPRPMQVGDFYWLSFDAEQLTIGSLFARCLRCRFVSEDAFEVGFRFLETIDVATALPSSA